MKYLYRFDCPCGQPSSVAFSVDQDVPEWLLRKRADGMMQEHVRLEGNEYDPTKLKLIAREDDHI